VGDQAVAPLLDAHVRADGRRLARRGPADAAQAALELDVAVGRKLAVHDRPA
jgi:hypothetical protein